MARYGGEEFAVILPNTGRFEALEAAERLRGAIEAMRGLEREVTASFGVATQSDGLAAAPELIAGADKALYASKHAGRNRVTHAELLLAIQGGAEAADEAVVSVHNIVSHDIVSHNVISSERS